MDTRILTQEQRTHAPVEPPDKRVEFDHYWETRNLRSVDLRTRRRIAIIESMLSAVPGTMLDVGCGRGTVAAHFAENGYSVTAIDISPLAVRWTKRQHPVIKACVLDIENEPLTGPYDVILCLEVLQQVRHPIDAVMKMRDALSPDGCLIVSLPNEFHLARRLAILAGMVTFGGIDDTHIKLYTPREHRRLFERCGLTIEMTGTQSIVPPRWLNGKLHDWTAPLAQAWPSLFALSCVYRLSVSDAPVNTGQGRADQW
ncbi:MAG: hypothetical protein Kow0074_18830 [Candidatus Zixiibacteriota bacterium]